MSRPIPSESARSVASDQGRTAGTPLRAGFASLPVAKDVARFERQNDIIDVLYEIDAAVADVTQCAARLLCSFTPFHVDRKDNCAKRNKSVMEGLAAK
jgi:hypothetical protein